MQLLETFEGSEKWYSDIYDLQKAGIDIDHSFTFHLLHLQNRRLIEEYGGEGKIQVEFSMDGSSHLVHAPLRMTAQGHDFLSALREPKALAATKAAASGGLGVAIEVGKAVLTSLVMNRLGLGP